MWESLGFLQKASCITSLHVSLLRTEQVLELDLGTISFFSLDLGWSPRVLLVTQTLIDS